MWKPCPTGKYAGVWMWIHRSGCETVCGGERLAALGNVALPPTPAQLPNLHLATAAGYHSCLYGDGKGRLDSLSSAGQV